jgi:hypothetical protein
MGERREILDEIIKLLAASSDNELRRAQRVELDPENETVG